jgi:MiaB-like tRNA modifying enzyme
VTDKLEDADLILVNTCAVKGPTQRRVLNRLEKLHRLNGKDVVVAGCLPLIDLKSIDRLGTFAGIVSCHSLDSIAKVVSQISRGKNNVRVLDGISKKVSAPRRYLSDISAPVAICEGCTSNCSYCSVKFARGRLRSFGIDGIVEEIRNALRSGHREILLTAQDTAAYGMDTNKRLPDLLRQIVSVEGEFRVRVGMMNPASAKRILPNLMDAYENEKIYKFLHLPVQSGDDGVLAEMRRDHTVEEFERMVNEFRERFRDLYLATDVIVGFPGETEEAFKNTCDLIERIRPDKVNLTRFSPMPRTDAAKLPQLEGREVKRRSRLLSAKYKEIGHEQNKLYVNRTMSGLIVEKGKKGGYVARLPNYKPAIVERGELGNFVTIGITEARPTYLLGEVVGVNS